MAKRQLRYNVSTDTTEQAYFKHRWTIALINELREIKRIQERIFSQLSPSKELCTNYEKQIQNSKGLHCIIFSFDSTQGKFTDPSRIYSSSNFKRDRDLRDVSEEKLENYVRVLIG